MPIYVETTIHGDLDELWRRPQTPELHEQWDLRFTSITYLPRADENQPQRFSYRTRLGFGLAIAGEGETIGNRADSRGQHTSVLKFWSNDWKSLISVGSGYWKYTPTAHGVRFVTAYDYQTRFGVAGRIFDRLIFRPLMGWATAWSFDRLRLWIEHDLDPRRAGWRSIAYGLNWALLGRSRTVRAEIGASVPLARRCLRKPGGTR